MALGKRDASRQDFLFLAAKDLVRSPGHPFYERLNDLLREHRFDLFVEDLCACFYADGVGRPGLAPGTYFRMQFLGFFEGIDSERGIAWKCADSLSLRSFLGLGLDARTPDHSTLSKVRKRLDLETHLQVFDWMLGMLQEHGLVKGKNLAIDATTLEANAAMRSLLRTDGDLNYQDHLRRLAESSGVATPTREDLRRMDRKRKKRMSNDEWNHPHDPDARIARLKDGRTRMSYKMEHGTDLDTEAVLSVTVHPGDRGDTQSVYETLGDVSERLAQQGLGDPDRVIADKGYHSDAVLEDLDAMAMASCIPSKQQKRNWKNKAEAQQRWDANERRVRSKRGVDQARRRSLVGERPFAHLKLLGGLGRLWVRGMEEVHKRVLLMTMAFNMSLVMRKLLGFGKPRCFQARESWWESLSVALCDFSAVVLRLGNLRDCDRIPEKMTDCPQKVAA